jgi:hypothetical protein
MKFDPSNKIIAWATIVVAVGTMATVLMMWHSIREENERARIAAIEARDQNYFRVSVDVLMKLVSQFDEPRFRQKRKLAAQAILKSNAKDNNIYDIMDFFETVGLMVHRNALDKEMVWSEFSDLIEGYWTGGSKLVQPEIQEDSTFYLEFNILNKTMDSISVSKGTNKMKLPDFLQMESTLVPR